MPPGNNGHAATAIDFATRTVFGDKITDSEKDEVVDTLRELIAYFGQPAIVQACYDLQVLDNTPDHASERTLQTLRAYSTLILESDRPMLTAQLVGKLAGLEITTGKRIILREIGRAQGISKQAVSKRLSYYADRLNLPRPDSTPEARTAYRLKNRRNFSCASAPIQTC